MKRPWFLFLLPFILFSSASLFGQSERQSEFTFAYSNLQALGLPDKNDLTGIFGSDFFNNRTTLHGFNTEATKFLAGTFGLTGDFSLNTNKRSNMVINGSDSVETDILYFMGGPTLTLGSGRFEPFTHFLAGGARTRFNATSKRSFPSGDLTSTFKTGATDFALGMGGGLDLRMGDAFKVRLIQIDYVPVFLSDQSINTLQRVGAIDAFTLNGQRMDNVRFTFGIVF
jgi:opacity protein-like surface antigen